MHNVISLHWKLEPIQVSSYIICNCVYSFKYIRGLQNVTKDVAMEVLIIVRLYIMAGSWSSFSKSPDVHHNSGVRHMISLYSWYYGDAASFTVDVFLMHSLNTICMSYSCDYTLRCTMYGV
jgi:hypothetical protein